MVRLFPAPLHRLALKAAHALRKRWWRIRRPHILGCRVMALDGEGRVLLIRHSYGSRMWMLPGGGVGRSEDTLAAAVRELREETSCVLEEARRIATLVESLSGARNEVHVVTGRVSGEARADGREVIEARFFALDAMPVRLSGSLRKNIHAWLALCSDHSSDS